MKAFRRFTNFFVNSIILSHCLVHLPIHKMLLWSYEEDINICQISLENF